MNYKQALGLGFELSSFIYASYLFHKPVADQFGWDPDLTISVLMGISLVVWTIHAFIYFNGAKD